LLERVLNLVNVKFSCQWFIVLVNKRPPVFQSIIDIAKRLCQPVQLSTKPYQLPFP